MLNDISVMFQPIFMILSLIKMIKKSETYNRIKLQDLCAAITFFMTIRSIYILNDDNLR